MTYLVRLGDRLWLTRAELDDEEGERVLGTDDPEDATSFPDAVAAAHEVGRVSTVRPLGDYKLRSPLLDGGARIQRLEEAREEASLVRPAEA